MFTVLYTILLFSVVIPKTIENFEKNGLFELPPWTNYICKVKLIIDSDYLNSYKYEMQNVDN